MTSALGYRHPNAEIEDRSDTALINFWADQVFRNPAKGTNAVRARIKDLIDERDARGLSLDDRKAKVKQIVEACQQLVGEENRDAIDARHQDWRNRRNFRRNTTGRPDVTGRVSVETVFPDGYRETWLGSPEEYAELVQGEIATQLADKEAARQVRVSGLPDQLQGVIDDPEALFKSIAGWERARDPRRTGREVHDFEFAARDLLRTVNGATTDDTQHTLEGLLAGRLVVADEQAQPAPESEVT